MLQKLLFLFLPLLIMANVARVKPLQNDPKAKTILDQSTANFKTYKGINAKFTFTTENPDGTKSNTNGEIFLKGDKYKLTFSDQETICDQKVIWTYLKEQNEVQITDYEPQKNEITPSNLFTVYKNDFYYLYSSDAKIGAVNCNIIDLTPIDKSRSFFKVRIWVDSGNKMVKRMKIFDKNGTRYTYEITYLNTKLVLEDTFFKFDAAKHPGVNVEDLRL